MTRITPISVDIRLADASNLVDLILLQWWSTPPAEYRWQDVAPDELAFKRLVLARLGEWINRTNRKTRPLFIVAPENSVPHELADAIDSLMRTVSNCVFIAGMVPLSAAEYSKYGAAFRKPELDDDGLFVNTAGIWIRSAVNDDLDRYLQVKRFLVPEEELNFTKGDEVWLFTNDTSRGLTFFSSICADFTANSKIDELLSALDDQPSSVDLGFVVMMSSHRDAVEFGRAATAYFSRSTAARPKTDRSALFYLNNPAPDAQSTLFGASEIAFRYREVAPKKEIVKPTFSLSHSQGHYRALLRDNEPSLYYLRWQPLRLTDGGAGTADPLVFDTAQHVSLRDLPETLRFRNLPPVKHWLSSVWRAAVEKSVTWARANSYREDDWLDLWRTAMAWWVQQLGDSDLVAVKILEIFDDERFAPDRTHSREPTKWKPEFAIATEGILEAFLLLILISGRTARLVNRAVEHLSVGTWGVAFVYARDGQPFDAAWRAFRDNPKLPMAQHSRLLTVVVASRGSAWHSCVPKEREITRGASGYANPDPPRIVPTAVDTLLNLLTDDYEAGKNKISERVNHLFDDCTCL